MNNKRSKVSQYNEKQLDADPKKRRELLQTISLLLGDEHVPTNVKDDLVRRLIRKDESCND